MTPCPLCADEARQQFRLPHTIVYKCSGSECELLFAHPQLDDKNLAMTYESLYYPAAGNGHKPSHGNTPEAMLRQVFEKMKAEFGPLAGRRLLDHGCGKGKLCQVAQEYGLEATGIELDPEARKTATQEVGIDVYANINDFRNAHPRVRFDFVTLWEVVEHLRKPWHELRELSQLINTGGRLLLSTPNAGSLRARIQRESWSNLANPTHFYYFKRKSLTCVLERAGFAKVSELRFLMRYPEHGMSRRILNQILKSCRVQGHLIFTAESPAVEEATARTAEQELASMDRVAKY